jgi:hypothetical protein
LMVTVAWNPSTLKLYTGATGKICSSCCGTGPTTCPNTYTISFSGITACTPPVPYLIFTTGRNYGWHDYPGNPPFPDSVVYNGVQYRCLVTHFADQWYPNYWEPYNFNYSIPNGTFTLSSSSDESGCWYASGSGNAIMHAWIRNDGVHTSAQVRMDIKHKLYPSITFTERQAFNGSVYQVASTLCPTMTNDLSSNYCVNWDYYGALYEGIVGTGGTARMFPGSIGGWIVNTSYAVGNIVVHLAEKYICTVSHGSTIANEPGVGSQWSSYWSVSPC